MRLTEKEISIIKNTIHKYFGKDLKIYLFGSRTDDTKQGGDIDLYILTHENENENVTYKRLLTKSKLKEFLFKPVDLIVSKTKLGAIDEEALRGIEISA
ncbi:MAG: nucleotidyltransferase domain-containing protein [Campylobacterota bacterium]|nr:nucleotidyltransferase domain-containing protein [Campylobacterota bacterium]